MVTDYIERRAVLALTDDYELTLPDDEIFFEYIDPKKVAAIPASDVRPVVLCRDCKHNKGAEVWRFLDLEDTTANCSAGHGYPPMDWFCADGEKREEN